MAKKSIEQVFQQKLGADERKPSPEAWKRVAAQLPQKPRKRGGWLAAWLMAGSFAAFGGWCSWKYAHQQPAGVLSQEKIPAVAQLLADSAKAPLPEAATIDLSMPEVAVNKLAVEKAVPTVKIRSSNKTKTGKKAEAVDKIATIMKEAEPALAIDFPKEANSHASETANLAQSMGYLEAKALLPLASGQRPRHYRYRVEITIPYQQPVISHPTTEPKSKAMMQKLLHNVLAD